MPYTVAKLDLNEGNPVTELTLYRTYAAHCLPDVRVLDGAPVTASERARGEQMFASAHQLRRVAEAEWRESGMPQPAPGSTRRYAKATSSFVAGVVRKAVEKDEASQVVMRHWPEVVGQIVADLVRSEELSDAECHNKLQDLAAAVRTELGVA